jgi:hypothetical protein
MFFIPKRDLRGSGTTITTVAQSVDGGFTAYPGSSAE